MSWRQTLSTVADAIQESKLNSLLTLIASWNTASERVRFRTLTTTLDFMIGPDLRPLRRALLRS